MKKYFILLVLALSAVTMSAQIELTGIYDGEIACDEFALDCGKFPITENDSVLKLANEDASIYKTIRFPQAENNSVNEPTPPSNRAPQATMGWGVKNGFYLVSRNIFTTDNKITFLRIGDGNIAIYDEDKMLIKQLLTTSMPCEFGLKKVNGHFYLIILEIDDSSYPVTFKSYIYSLPGTGEISTDFDSPTAPIRTSNVQKVIENGQMYIILDGIKYAVSGSEM